MSRKYISKIQKGGNDIFIKDIEARDGIQDSNGFSMCMSLINLSSISSLTQVTNPEWKYAILDHDDKVLCGVKVDGQAYVYATVTEIMDCIISSYNS